MESPGTSGPRPDTAGRERSLHPFDVRVWHFLVLPPLAMGALLLLARLAATALHADAAPLVTSVFAAVRTAAVAAAMAAFIGWLALGYHRQYERRLEARNRTLEQTRDFLARIIDGCGEAIVTLDASERVTSWNPAAERIFGWSAQEMLGQSYDRLLPDDATILEQRQEVTRALSAGREVRDHVTRRLHRGGRPITVRVTWTPLRGADGKPVGSTAIVLDITAETEMRQRLVERERLAAVGELAAQVAHEVRNPLAGIRGACEVVMGGRTGEAQRNEVAAEVVRQIDRLSRTVSDLLEYSRPPSIEPQLTDVHRLIDRVAEIFFEDPQTRGIRLDLRYAPDLPPVRLDPGPIQQVLYNLLINAAQMMERGGTITVTTSFKPGLARICVRDTGPGIPPEVAAQLFRPFFTTRAKGTGLGLAIVKKIVVAHEGTIEVHSTPGSGAEFRIQLPI